MFLLMVSFHEFGHYIIGRLFKFNIEEYAIGFGPKIVSKTSKKNGIVYSIRCIPFGGFCKFGGEEEKSIDKNDFRNKPAWQRLLVSAAGGIFNIVMGIVFFALVLIMQSTVETTTINYIVPNSYMEQVGLQAGDKIIAVNGEKMFDFSDLQIATTNLSDVESTGIIKKLTQKFQKTTKKENNEIQLTVLRNSEKKSVNIKKSLSHETFTYTEDGVQYTQSINDKEIVSYLYEYGKEADYDKDKIGKTVDYDSEILGFSPQMDNINLKNIIPYTINSSISTTKMVYKTLYWLINGKIGIDSMSGPIGMVRAVNTVTEGLNVKNTIMTMCNLIALLSFNLGLFNLLPIPALDGGHIVLNLIEIIRRRKLSEKVEMRISKIGMYCIYALMIFVVINDIFKAIIGSI